MSEPKSFIITSDLRDRSICLIRELLNLQTADTTTTDPSASPAQTASSSASVQAVASALGLTVASAAGTSVGSGVHSNGQVMSEQATVSLAESKHNDSVVQEESCPEKTGRSNVVDLAISQDNGNYEEGFENDDSRQFEANLIESPVDPTTSTPVPEQTNEHPEVGLASRFGVVVVGGQSSVNSQNRWQFRQCRCGKRFVTSQLYQIHSSTCEQVALVDKLPALQHVPLRLTTLKTPTVNENSSLDSENENHPERVSFSFRKVVRFIHRNDRSCKCCKKKLKETRSVPYHVSQRPVCREWYYDNMAGELEKLRKKKFTR